MNYKEAIDYISTTKKFGSKPGLERIRRLCELLGDPQKALKFAHVAGTNGKGSVCACLSSVLMRAGYKTGLFTSPAIQRFSERIRIDSVEISEEEVARYTSLIKSKIDIMKAESDDHPTEFEILTAMAMLHYKKHNCDIVVLEVGMGGIIDSTNIIDDNTSLVAVITSIGFDHMEYLGTTLSEIAAKKAGIIKKGGMSVVYPAKPEVMAVFEEVCRQKNSGLRKLDDKEVEILTQDINGTSFDFGIYKGLNITLLGKYQVYNAALSMLACEELRAKGFKISEENIREGLQNAKWAGRFEIVNREPLTIIDGAHNPEGARALLEGLECYFPGRKLIFICGCLADKDVGAIFKPFGAIAKRFITITPDSPRAKAGEELESEIRRFHKDVVHKNNVDEALDYALSTLEPEDVICAFGSLYFIGGVRDYFGLV
ncbi:MAG: bifunctional folylpolyglutamate synthase/dihydrofolate synthase [Defluviitaleaceae bacterium]|nr:bifunctional folylpolyglutamate synthase/dihydrofolate synthase [Defluviitaleaceae bacterium]